VVEVLHAPHPKLLGLLLVGGEHLTAHTQKEGSQHTFREEPEPRTQENPVPPLCLVSKPGKSGWETTGSNGERGCHEEVQRRAREANAYAPLFLRASGHIPD
jgi:hypothetical protein